MCNTQGFASISDVPLGHIEIENYNLSITAIHTAIYNAILSDKYQCNGKIITKDASNLDAVAILKNNYAGRESVTFNEASDRVIELTGGTHRQIAFQALYDDFVRIDCEHFVANKYVEFNVDEIDDVLSGIYKEHFGAIKDVTTFAMFPICGQPWNHYVLESYCYKYSKKFSLHVINFNDKNAGIIAEKTYNKKYDEMLAIFLAKSGVVLKPEIIGPYLFANGYMAKSKYGLLEDIAKKAQEIRGN
jgi:hypothetical protein